MKLLYKRILLFFSVALNIGFVIMAVFMFFNHPEKSRVKSGIEAIVLELDLTEYQQENALECIHRLRVSVDKKEMEIRAARDKMIHMASKSGPLDQQQLNELCYFINQEERDRNNFFLSHVVEMRNLLGDEKGARFYSLLLEHLKKKDNPNHK